MADTPSAPVKYPEYQQSTPEIGNLEGQLRDVVPSLERTLAPMQAERTNIQNEITSMGPVPEPPKLGALPQFQPRQISPEESQQFMGLSLAVASLASLATRRPLTTALNSAASAMDGFSKGNLEQGKRDIENFNTQYNAAFRQNQQMLQEYDTILKSRQYTMQQKMQMLQVIATREHDEIALAQLRSGDLRGLLDLNQKRLDGMNRWGADAAKFYETQNYHAGMLAAQNARIVGQYGTPGQPGGGGLSQDAIDNAAAYYILNGRMPVGMARVSPAAISAIQNRAGEMTQAAGLTPQEFAAAGPVTRQKLGALLQLEKNRSAVQSFEGMLDMNIDILKQLSERVSRTNSPYLNRPVLWLQQNAAGDQDVAEYLFQVRTVSTEIARILNNPSLSGQLTDTARAELDGVVSGNLSPEQLNAVLARAQSDARNRSTMLDKQVEKLIAEVRDPLHKSGGAQPGPGGQAMRSKSKSGRDIMSTDGGRSWVYAQ